MKILRGSILALCLYLAVLLQPADAAYFSKSIELGRALIFRLYRSTSEAHFICTGFWLGPSARAFQHEVVSAYGLTAGHCAFFGPLYRRVAPHIWNAPFFYGATKGQHDVAVFIASQWREDPKVYTELRLTQLEINEPVAIVGFGKSTLRTAICRALGSYTIQEVYELHTAYCPSVSQRPAPGSSGSPILDVHGKIVGLVWGLNVIDRSIVYFTPSAVIDRIARAVSPYPKIF